MPFLSILLRYQLKRRKRRKRVVLKNRYDSNHQSLYKNIKLYNDIDWNPGPEYVNESTEYCYLHRLLNSCTLCVPIFLVRSQAAQTYCVKFCRLFGNLMSFAWRWSVDLVASLYSFYSGRYLLLQKGKKCRLNQPG